MSLSYTPRQDERWGAPAFSNTTPLRGSPRGHVSFSRSSMNTGYSGSPIARGMKTSSGRNAGPLIGGLYASASTASQVNTRIGNSQQSFQTSLSGISMGKGSSRQIALSSSPLKSGTHMYSTPTKKPLRETPTKGRVSAGSPVSKSGTPTSRSKSSAMIGSNGMSTPINKGDRVLRTSGYVRSGTSASGNGGYSGNLSSGSAMRSSMLADKENVLLQSALGSPRLTKFTSTMTRDPRTNSAADYGVADRRKTGHLSMRTCSPTVTSRATFSSTPFSGGTPDRRSQGLSVMATPPRTASTSATMAAAAYLRGYSRTNSQTIALGNGVGTATRRNATLTVPYVQSESAVPGTGRTSDGTSTTATSVGTRRSTASTVTASIDGSEQRWQPRELLSQPQKCSPSYLGKSAATASTPVKRSLHLSGSCAAASSTSARLEPRRKSPTQSKRKSPTQTTPMSAKYGARKVDSPQAYRGTTSQATSFSQTGSSLSSASPRSQYHMHHHPPAEQYSASRRGQEQQQQQLAPLQRSHYSASSGALVASSPSEDFGHSHRDPFSATSISNPPSSDLDCGITRVQRPVSNTPRRLALYGGDGKNTPRSRAAASAVIAASANASGGKSTTAAHSTKSAAVDGNGAAQLLPHHALRHRPLLVLDLDETLVHAAVETPEGPYELSFAVPVGDNQSVRVFVAIRPHAREFLKLVASWFEVCVFTASVTHYADAVIDYLDPSRELVHHRLYRQHCTMYQGTYVKDLSRLGRPLSRVLIVDNSTAAFQLHKENGFPIESWFDAPDDEELHHLIGPLEHFYKFGDAHATVARYVS